MGSDMRRKNLMEYHLHTAVTLDGRMNEIEACERAQSLGIHEIAFTNHVMLNQPDYTVTPAAFINHWHKIQDCQARYPGLNIRIGLEMDYYLNREEEIAHLLQSYTDLIGRPLDFIFGSIHEIDGIFFSNKHRAPGFFKDRDLLSLYQAYFELATLAVNSGLFDVIAHPDLIKKYTYDLTPPLLFKAYEDFVAPFLEALIKNGVGLEVNTRGLKLALGQVYPSVELLQSYLARTKAQGIEPIITLGSDAHKADDIGLKISETVDWLSSLGVKKLTCFDRHHRLGWPI